MKPSATALHESGHAISASLLGVRVESASIIPTTDGISLGHTRVAASDSITHSRKFAVALLVGINSGGDRLPVWPLDERKTLGDEHDLIELLHAAGLYDEGVFRACCFRGSGTPAEPRVHRVP